MPLCPHTMPLLKVLQHIGISVNSPELDNVASNLCDGWKSEDIGLHIDVTGIPLEEIQGGFDYMCMDSTGFRP